MGKYHSKSGIGDPVSGDSPVLDHATVLTTDNKLPSGSDLSSRGKEMNQYLLRNPL